MKQKRLIHNLEVNPLKLGAEIPLKKQVVRGKRVKGTLEDGKRLVGSTDSEIIEVDSKQFCKVMPEACFAGIEAKPSGKDLLFYILAVMPADQDWLILEPDVVSNHLGHTSTSSFYEGVKELGRLMVLIKAKKTPDKYFINIDGFFNGKRDVFVKKYISEFDDLPATIKNEYEDRKKSIELREARPKGANVRNGKNGQKNQGG